VREAAEEDGRQLHAIVCESRPLCEGVALAEAAGPAAGVWQPVSPLPRRLPKSTS
jgi:hypothetical protein